VQNTPKRHHIVYRTHLVAHCHGSVAACSNGGGLGLVPAREQGAELHEQRRRRPGERRAKHQQRRGVKSRSQGLRRRLLSLPYTSRGKAGRVPPTGSAVPSSRAAFTLDEDATAPLQLGAEHADVAPEAPEQEVSSVVRGWKLWRRRLIDG
jgi:hypothetical protein